MKENNFERRDVGAIGIGAMIVFIALILVAAVASAVIIQTAEKLQQNAQTTGEDTREEIGGKIQIHGAYYGDAGEGFDLIFSLAPGSDTIRDIDIDWQLFCMFDTDQVAGGNAFGQDAGTFDVEPISLLSAHDTTTAEGAFSGITDTDSLATGTKYVITLGDEAASIVDCDPVQVNNDWAANGGSGKIEMYIHVTGGGTTYETLSVAGSLNEGDSLL